MIVYNTLKGVFAKMKGGIGLRRKIIDGEPILIFLLSVAFIKIKLLKRLIPHKFRKLQQNQFNSKQIIQIL